MDCKQNRIHSFSFLDASATAPMPDDQKVSIDIETLRLVAMKRRHLQEQRRIASAEEHQELSQQKVSVKGKPVRRVPTGMNF